MSVDSPHASGPSTPDAAALFARVAAAERRAEVRLATAIDDLFLVEDDRLDDRTRAALGAMLSGAVRAIARELAGHAARHVADGFESAEEAPALLGRLLDAGVLRDRALMDELLGQVRQNLLGDALIANRAPGSQPVLLPRLAGSRDGVISVAARAYLLAENRRRSSGAGCHGELSSHSHRHLVWWIAAALRRPDIADPARQAEIDRALVAAAERSLAAHDDQDRLNAIALRLAVAIDPRPAEMADLLVESIDEGLSALFVGLLAHMVSIDFKEARALVLDPDGDRLWLALRARGFDRATIARIGLALSDADPRRDIDAFADMLDTIAAIPPETARTALEPLSLHPEFRAAIRAFDRKERR
jgi:hypothetical protein